MPFGRLSQMPCRTPRAGWRVVAPLLGAAQGNTGLSSALSSSAAFQVRAGTCWDEADPC